ncbi:MAG: hypothetical protein HRF48_05215 [Chloroflexota bacterium]
MTSQAPHPPRLLERASDCRCAHCPPERVCAWSCVQGLSPFDIVIGAALEQSDSWALQTPAPGQEAVHQALWETYNA